MLLLPPEIEEIREVRPLEFNRLEELNKFFKELDSDDEESLAEKHSNKHLKKVNLKDAKPQLHCVNRTEEIDKMRQELPVFLHEREILESVENNLVTIICGETGSGKSTQVPQFLYEYGYTSTTRRGMIGITQPRRVAATSLSKRISEELNFNLGEEVGYQIRYDKKFISQNTVIKLMTDGILLKEIELDHLLEKYSVVIIDEAHERSINTDILISLLSRIVRLRLRNVIKERKEVSDPKLHSHFPLRLVIMSATLRVDDFMKNKKLFPNTIPRLLKVESRQHSVDIHFNKVTKEDYEEETFKKICKIHRNLPSGGILVFLTGRKEIEYMVERVKMEFKHAKIPNLIQIKEEKCKTMQEDSDEDMEENITPVQVLPLYSMLSPEQQLKVFKPPKEGHRLIVISTNIAETSITIPNIRYVIDSGREKQKIYEPHLRLSKFQISWVSKASADQRAGRAGRTGPGHCYRLFSSTVFHKMSDFSTPEILRTPLSQTILQLKSIGITSLTAFPFVSPPDLAQTKATLRELCVLGALQLESGSIEEEFRRDLIEEEGEKMEEDAMGFNKDRTRISDLGLVLATVPIEPRFAKMLIFGRKANIVELAIIAVASLTIHELFMVPNVHLSADFGEDEMSSEEEDPDLMTQIDIDRKLNKLKKKQIEVKEKKKEFRKEQLTMKFKVKEKWFSERGDIHTNVLALGAYLQYFGQQKSKLLSQKITQQEMSSSLFTFIKSLSLNKKVVDEVVNLSQQLQKIMQDLSPSVKIDIFGMEPPTAKQQTLLQQLIIVGFPENIATKKEILNNKGVDVNLQKKRPAYE
jgi:ATP-dependent RNA helicase DHX37/DHR1